MGTRYCRHCGAAFSTILEWKDHQEEIHRAGARTVPAYCQLCARSFVNSEALQQHCADSKAHKQETRQQEENHYVREHMLVPKLAGLAVNLSERMSPIKPKCNVCEREFTTESALQSHIENSSSHKSEQRRARAAEEKLQDLGKSVHGVWSVMSQAERHKDLRAATTVPPLVGSYAVTGTAEALESSSASGSVRKMELDSFEQQLLILCKFYALLRDPGGAQSFFWHLSTAWSIVPSHLRDEVLDLLAMHCHPAEILRERHWRLAPYTEAELVATRKCKQCKGVLNGVLIC